ncbi:hypothetical protein [Fervidibacillus albus]|uniref:Uncharacterized protein n=1 Tax=Fervidibacillus albus TaxID=2980026 RepID=A0A9E8LS72_9BACI|nr:hypothetical protein [Fervidibacillus albus]WAA08620.1 hypothetical protein OE104_08160 [Fervidibacillus albus]
MRTFFLLSLIFSFVFYVFSLNHSYVIGLLFFVLTLVALAGTTVAELSKITDTDDPDSLNTVR